MALKKSVKLTDYQVESLLLIDSTIQKAIDTILSEYKRHYPIGISNPLRLNDLIHQNFNITVLLTESQINKLSYISSSIQDAFNKVFLIYENNYPTITSVSAFNGSKDLMMVTTPTNFFLIDSTNLDIELKLQMNGIAYQTFFHDDLGRIFTTFQMRSKSNYFQEFLNDRSTNDYIYISRSGRRYYQTFKFKSKKNIIPLPLHSKIKY